MINLQIVRQHQTLLCHIFLLSYRINSVWRRFHVGGSFTSWEKYKNEHEWKDAIGYTEQFENSDSCPAYDIVMGDETWTYQSESRTESQAVIWVFSDDTCTMKVERSRSVKRQWLLFFSKCLYVTIILQTQCIVTAQGHMTICPTWMRSFKVANNTHVHTQKTTK
jgi:hypothetical protein